MNFENYGSHWHIDHVIPCSLFDLTSEDEIKNCFRWTNLQPLEAKINIIKNNNINQVEVISHYNKVNEYTKFKKKKLYNFDYNKYF
jgi:5-methylcytosine-specific restriction endonuclease McrA